MLYDGIVVDHGHDVHDWLWHMLLHVEQTLEDRHEVIDD